ncbi:hypothetical protein HA402_009757 [Bradysia odoriphaga]|nr:hypothetical protein HA402_009757 [Bradysia odoriphaga]
MDLLMYFVFVIIFCLSVFSLMYINSKFRVGKTYEEVQAEKKQFADKLYGSSHGKNQKKSNRKVINKKGKDKDRKQKDRKEQEPESQNDSDGHSDSASGESNNTPVHATNKGHVEFSEAEVIAEDVTNTKKPHGKRHQNRKNSASKPPGTSILTNKSDAVVVAPATNNTETLNHFEEIQPKDDLEMRKQKIESAENVKPNKKDGKKLKNKKDVPSPKTEKPNPSVVENAVVEKEVAVTESPKIQSVKEKPNKKKKSEPTTVAQHFNDVDYDMNVSAMIGMLGKVDLTRGEIQILIDYLLNKQQDTIVNHSDWSDDIVQKLRRQLEDKDRELAEEQKVTIGFQNKFRELRAEIISERTNSQTRIALLTDELHAKKLEIQTIRQELTFQAEKFANEHKVMSNSIQQLQTALFKEKQNHTQDQNQHQQMIDENFSKTQIMNDLQEKFHQFQGETTNKLAEYEQKLQEYDMIMRQNEADLANLNADNQRLRAEEQLYIRQKYDLEQLKIQVAEQSSKANHLDDSSKVEIRNLQNALDSSKKELTLCRSEVADNKAKMDECNKQIAELKSALDLSNTKLVQQVKQVNDLNSALTNYKKDVAEKDSKLSDYQKQLQSLTGKEDELFKQIADYKNKNNHPPIQQQVEDEQIRTKQILERLFPDCPKGPADYHQWMDHIATYIEQRNVAHLKQQNNNSASSEIISTKNHINNSDTHSDSTGTAATEDLILQNAKLQATVDEYKTIVAETENVLKNLERKVIEQDAYWRDVVNTKDTELQSLKTTTTQNSNPI